LPAEERSDSPDEVEAFDLVHLTDDIVALLDALDVERAVFAGHDWGGFVSWAMPVLHPDRCLGAIGVNTPYVAFPSTQVLRGVFSDPEKLYILWFQEPGVAEAFLDANVRIVFEKLMRRGTPPSPGGLAGMADANPFKRIREIDPAGESFLSEEEISLYTRAFEQSGFRGPVNWYRNIDRNQERVPGIGEKKLDLPCLQITAAWDAAIPPSMAAGMPLVCSDLEVVAIEECGHWTQQEKPEELSGAMIDWLTRQFAR